MTPHAPTDAASSLKRAGRLLRRLATAALLGVALGPAPAAADVFIEPGSAFPDLEFPGLMSPQDYPNLGLARPDGTFRLSQIPGEVLVLEFFNKSCVPCQRQVRELEEFFQSVRSGPQAGRVRVLAVAAGNQAKYLPKYIRERGLTYPIAVDEQFDQWRRLGEPGRTPFTVFLARRGGGWVLASYHFGVQWKGEFTEHVSSLLAGKPLAKRPATLVTKPERHLALPLDSSGVRALAEKLLARAAGREVAVEILDLGGGRQVYRVRVPGGGPALYAAVGSRQPVCEVCHAVHFLYAFDATGRVRGFEPIHVTKLNNEEWDPEENRFLEARLLGRPMELLAFDAEVDAVTTATMSSALIFDEIRRAVELLENLKRR